MPDSLMTQSGWNSSPLSRGRRWGSNSSRNTLARTSSAAAEHFPGGEGKHVRSPLENSEAARSHRLLDTPLSVRNLRRFQSESVSSSSSSSSSMSSPSSPSPPSCCRVTVRDLWKRGLMSCSLSGIASSSSTSPWRAAERRVSEGWTQGKGIREEATGVCGRSSSPSGG